MAKKKQITRAISRDFVLVPEEWLRRLVELSAEDGMGAQQLKGYISTADVLLMTSKRITETDYYKLENGQ